MRFRRRERPMRQISRAHGADIRCSRSARRPTPLRRSPIPRHLTAAPTRRLISARLPTATPSFPAPRPEGATKPIGVGPNSFPGLSVFSRVTAVNAADVQEVNPAIRTSTAGGERRDSCTAAMTRHILSPIAGRIACGFTQMKMSPPWAPGAQMSGVIECRRCQLRMTQRRIAFQIGDPAAGTPDPTVVDP
jgi:hypothetical protein